MIINENNVRLSPLANMVTHIERLDLTSSANAR